MKLAQVSETLTVIGETPLVDTASSQVAGNVDRRQMEQLPLQGRNWMELSKLVKGITANDVGNSPASAATSLPAEPRRPADHPEGGRLRLRPAAVQPRVDRGVPDRHEHVRHHAGPVGGHRGAGDLEVGHEHHGRQRLRLLPQRQAQLGRSGRQAGAAVPEPAGRRHARRPDRQGQGALLRVVSNTSASRAPSSRARRRCRPELQLPFKNRQKSFLARVDDQLATNNRLSIRGSRWDWENPFVLAAGGHPSNALISDEGRDQHRRHLVEGDAGDNKVQEIKGGYNGFHWTRTPSPGENGVEYNFVGLTIGAPYNYPQLFHQNNLEARST